MKAYKYPADWVRDFNYDGSERWIYLSLACHEGATRCLIDCLVINDQGFISRSVDNPTGMKETTVDKDKVLALLFSKRKQLKKELAEVKELERMIEAEEYDKD
jgi:hypothetical protein